MAKLPGSFCGVRWIVLFFRPFGPQFGLKMRGVQALPGPSPGSPTGLPSKLINWVLFFVSAWTTSIIISVMCFTSPTSGGLLNRFGIRTSTILGCLLCSSALAMGSFVPTIVTLFIAFSLPFGLGLGLIYLNFPVVATHYFIKRRSIALGFLMAGQGIGTMILSPTLQALVDAFDWRNTFRGFAGLLALASLTGWLLHKGIAPPNEPAEVAPKGLQLHFGLLRNPVLLILILTRCSYVLCRLTPYVHLVSLIVSCAMYSVKGKGVGRKGWEKILEKEGTKTKIWRKEHPRISDQKLNTKLVGSISNT